MALVTRALRHAACVVALIAAAEPVHQPAPTTPAHSHRVAFTATMEGKQILEWREEIAGPEEFARVFDALSDAVDEVLTDLFVEGRFNSVPVGVSIELDPSMPGAWATELVFGVEIDRLLCADRSASAWWPHHKVVAQSAGLSFATREEAGRPVRLPQALTFDGELTVSRVGEAMNLLEVGQPVVLETMFE